MKLFLIFAWLVFSVFSSHAASTGNPSFGDFLTNYFTTTGNKVGLRTNLLLTNVTINTLNVSNLTFNTFTIPGDGTNSTTYHFPLTNCLSGQFLSVITNGNEAYFYCTNLPTSTFVFDTIEELVATPIPLPGIGLLAYVRDPLRGGPLAFYPNSVDATNGFNTFASLDGPGNWKRPPDPDIRLEWGAATGFAPTNSTLISALVLNSASGSGQVKVSGNVTFLETSPIALLDNNKVYFEDGNAMTGLTLYGSGKTNVALYGGHFLASVGDPSIPAISLTNCTDVVVQSPSFTGYSGEAYHNGGGNSEVNFVIFDVDSYRVVQDGSQMIFDGGNGYASLFLSSQTNQLGAFVSLFATSNNAAGLSIQISNVIGARLEPSAAAPTVPYIFNALSLLLSTNDVLQVNTAMGRVFSVSAISGWTGTGTNVFSDDGTFKAAGGGGITGSGTLNFMPIWTGETALGNSPFSFISSQAIQWSGSGGIHFFTNDIANGKIGIGPGAMRQNTGPGGDSSWFVTGVDALAENTGSGNVWLVSGDSALYQNAGTGNNWTVSGGSALAGNIGSGNNWTVSGYYALESNTSSGDDWVVHGNHISISGNGDYRFGYGSDLTLSGTNVLGLGWGASTTNDNQFVIGNTLNTYTFPGSELQIGGNITFLRGQPTSFPGTNAAGVLSNDGSGNLDWLPGTGGGTTINATDGVIPYRSSATAFADSPIVRLDASSVSVASLATVGAASSQGYFQGNNSGDALQPTFSFGSGDGYYHVANTHIWSEDGTQIARLIYNNSPFSGAGALSIGAGAIYFGGSPLAFTNSISSGYGTPEGVLAQPEGSLYLDRTTSGGKVWIKATGTGNTGWTALGTGAGDFVGPSSSTDNAIARFDGTTGKLGQNSVVTISDAGAVSGAASLAVTNGVTAGTYNGNTITTGTGTLTIAAAKTLTVNNSITFAGTDGTTMTFPSTSQTIPGLSQINTWTQNGAVSTSPNVFNGTWYSGGSATTTKPYVLIEPSATTSTGWSTSGTGLGLNAASGFSGNLIDTQVAASGRFKVAGNGAVTMANGDGSGTIFFDTGNTATIKNTQSTGKASTLSPLYLSFGPTSTMDSGIYRGIPKVIYFTTGSASTTNDGWFLWAGESRVATAYTNATTTLGNVTGLAATLQAGRTYRFRARFDVTLDVTGLGKYAMSGTATATSISYRVSHLGASLALISSARQTALDSAVNSSTALTDDDVEIEGTIVVNAAGTLTVQAAEQSATGQLVVLTGGSMIVFDMP